MSGGIAPHTFLTSALDGGEWSASRPTCFTLGETAPGILWIGGWVGHRAAVAEWKISSSYRESNPLRPACSPAALWIETSWLLL